MSRNPKSTGERPLTIVSTKRDDEGKYKVVVSKSMFINWKLDANDQVRATGFMDLFAFQGMDADRIYEVVASRATEMGVTPEQFKDDLIAFASWIATRGTNVKEGKKAWLKTSEAGQDYMAKLKQTYSIIEGIPQGPEEVSMGRISAICAHFIVKFNNTVGNQKTVGEPPAGFKKAFCFPAAAALLPKPVNGVSKEFTMFLEWSHKFDVIANVNRSKDEVKARRDVEFYAKLVYDSKFYSDIRDTFYGEN